MIGRARRVKEFAYFQFKAFLGVFLYLWIIFALLSFHKAIILAQQHLEFTQFGFAFINALALAKVMLVARELHLAGKAFRDKPLIYPTLLKSFVFTLLLAFFKIIEEAAIRLYHGKSFKESAFAFVDHEAKITFSAALIVFFMLIPFFGFSELSEHFGEGRLATLFFRSRHNWLASGTAKEGAPLAGPDSH
jgi:hypothetical protein